MTRARDIANQGAGTYGSITADDLTVDTSTLVVDDANDRVGIGESSPGATLELKNSDQNPSIFRINNSYNAAGSEFGIDFYRDTDSGNDSAVAYVKAKREGGDVTTLVFGTTSTPGTVSERMRIASNGYLQCQGVYDQSAADSANVVVDGSGNIYRSTSALKYKQDIRDLESIDISTFRPVRYKSNIERDDQTLDHFGFIADEFHDAGLTELVSYGVADEETGVAEVEGFRYDRMTVVLTKALQEAMERIETLEAEVAELKGA